MSDKDKNETKVDARFISGSAMLILLIIMCVGDPDIIDGIVYYLMKD